MINYHSQLVKALSAILPTYYEMKLNSKIKAPCISYMELTNSDTMTGDTLGYSSITYQVKIWSTKVAELQDYAPKVDDVMRSLGFKRVGSAELYDPNSLMAQKVLTYNALGLEQFN